MWYTVRIVTFSFYLIAVSSTARCHDQGTPAEAAHNQQPPPASAAQPNRGIGRFRPSHDWQAHLTFEGQRHSIGNQAELRTILIHSEDPNADGHDPGRYYHRPLFAFVERSPNQTVPPGTPGIVQALDRRHDGAIVATFTVLISTDKLQAQCRNAVISQDRRVLKAVREDDITVLPWDIEHAIISCQHAATKEIFSVAETGTLTGRRKDFTFYLPFSPDAYARFCSAAQDGKVVFVFTYDYTGSETVMGKTTVTGTKATKALIQGVLTSQQIAGKAPITQADRDRVVRNIDVEVKRVVRLQHKDLYPLLETTQLENRLFDPAGALSLHDLKPDDEAAALHIAAYLKPLLQAIQEATAKSDAKLTLLDKEHLKELNVGGAFGIPGFKLTGDTKEQDKVRDQVQSTTGTDFQRVEKTDFFVPHSINKYALRTGWDSITLNDESVAYLSLRSETTHIEDPEVPIEFTATMADASLAKTNELDAFGGIRLGMMIRFFGSTGRFDKQGSELPPRGYVWADGKTLWPDAAWVPPHLRKKALVPKMEGWFLSGCHEVADVGSQWAEGKVTVTGTIPGGKLTLPALDPGPTVEIWTFEKDGDDHWRAVTNFGMNIQPSPVGLQGWKPNHTELVVEGKFPQAVVLPNIYFVKKRVTDKMGYHAVSNITASPTMTSAGELKTADTLPRHVRCRWIIRVE